jgi:hypothetical protein
MDGRVFDEATRLLAGGRSRRSLLKGLVGGGAALFAAKAGAALAQPPEKKDICHWDEEIGTHVWLAVSEEAWINGHESQHAEDFLRGDCCSDTDCGLSDECTTFTCETGSCSETSHAVGCVVSDWSEWSACSADCGGGAQTRSREILTEASCGGAACPDILLEEQACNTNACVTCGPGYQTTDDDCEPCPEDPTVGSVAGTSGVYTNSAGWTIPLLPPPYDPSPLAHLPGANLTQTCLGSTCPVIELCDLTFWVYSFIDNRTSYAIAAYDAAGNILGVVEKPGDRYITAISVDVSTETVILYGQSGSVTMTWAELLSLAGVV